MGNELITRNNNKKKDYIATTLEQTYKEYLVQGFYGQIGFVIKIQDGSIQKVERHIQQDYIT